MVVTVMRTDTPKLSTVLPTTTYANRLTKSADEIVLRLGTDPTLIEVQGRVVPSREIHDYMRQQFQGLSPHELEGFQVVLHADRTVKMMDIRAIKTALQENGLRNLRFISNTGLAHTSTYD